MTFECESMCNVHGDANLSVDLQTVWLAKGIPNSIHTLRTAGCHLTSFSGRKNDFQHLFAIFAMSTLSF